MLVDGCRDGGVIYDSVKREESEGGQKKKKKKCGSLHPSKTL